MQRSKSNLDRTSRHSDIIRHKSVVAKHSSGVLSELTTGSLGRGSFRLRRKNEETKTSKVDNLNLLGCYYPDVPDTPILRSNRVSARNLQNRKSASFVFDNQQSDVLHAHIKKTSSFRATLSRVNNFFSKNSSKVLYDMDEVNKDVLNASNTPDVLVGNTSGASEEVEFEQKRQFWTTKEKSNEKKAPKFIRSWRKGNSFCERSSSYEFLPQPNDLLNEIKVDTIKDWRKRETMYFNDEDDDDLAVLASLSESNKIPNQNKKEEENIYENLDFYQENRLLEDMRKNSREKSVSPESKELNAALVDFDRIVQQLSTPDLQRSNEDVYRKRNNLTPRTIADQRKRISVSLTNLPTSNVSSEESVVPSKMKQDHFESLNRILLNQMNRTTNRLSASLGTLETTSHLNRVTNRWISPQESLIYSRDQNPPFIIPRIKPYRPRHYSAENEGTPSSAKKAGVGESIPAHLQNDFEEPKSPTIKDVRKMFEEKGVSLASNESPKFIRVNKWTGGSNELLSSKNSSSQKTSEQQAIELRNRDLESLSRSHGKVKSMVTSTQWKTIMMPPRVLPRDFEPTDHVLFEGPANRTRLTENGKKVRKNWQSNYLVLTQTSLAFYKDIKGYHAMKLAGPQGTPPANAVVPELIFPMAGALVSASTPQHTRRANAYVLTSVKHHQVIIQHDEPATAKKWFDAILRAINKLPSDYTCPDNSTIQSPLTTPSPVQKRIPRSKSSSKVPESSMEDLSDPTEQTKIRSKLKKFFVRRPTMESLVRKGIYKDEPVFGQSLEEVCPKTDPRIPEFVMKCVEVIESSEENMTSDGLYRASGNLSQVQKIRLEVDQNNLSIMENEVDVHVLTGALKLFFRELKEPLIPCRLFQRALNASANRVYESKIKEFREIVHSLPECNRQTLMFLLKHLLRVTERKDKNRMHVANLAIVLGPTLLWAPSEAAHNIAVDCLQQNQVIETFLADYDNIFKEEGRRK